jgi:hypothetical protein
VYWTDPYGAIPNRVLLETRFAGGFRHGDESTRAEREYDRWWRDQVVRLLQR